MESRLVIARGWEDGKMGSDCLMGTGFGGNENSLEEVVVAQKW